MRFPVLLLFLLLCLSALVPSAGRSESSFSISGQFTDIITKETKTRELKGGLIISYPVDHDDLVDLILKDIESYRSARGKVSKKAVADLKAIVQDSKEDIQKRVQKLLGLEKLSDDFGEHYDKNAAEVVEVLEQWGTWSGGLSEIHLWNQVGARPFLEEEKQAFLFPEIAFAKGGEDEIKIFLFPPFFHTHGVGAAKVRRDGRKVEPFRLDLLHRVKPGVATSTAATEVTKALVSIHQLHNKLIKERAPIWVVHFLMERMLLHEIEAQFFSPDPPQVLTQAMARLYLMVIVKRTRKDEFSTFFPEMLVFPMSDEQTERATFLRDLEKVDPLAADVPEKFRTAAAMILFKGLLSAAQSEKKDQLTFVLFEELGIDTPGGGFTHADFLAALRKSYPSLDQQMSGAKKTMLESMRSHFIQTEKPTPKDKPEEKPLRFPESYETEKVGELTVTYPEALKEAAHATVKKFSDQITRADKILSGRFGENLEPPVKFGENDFESLRGYGIPAEEKTVASWSFQTAAMSNAAKFVLDLAKSRKLEIWMKDELMALLEEGHTSPYYKLGVDSDLSFNFNLTVSNSEMVGKSFEDFLNAYSSVESPPLPVAIKDNEIATKSLDEQIEAIREGDLLIKLFAEAAETLSPEDLTGSKGKILTERQMFFVIVHEVVEGDLIRKVIASQDRRWFCDGLANLIAIRECDRRYGAGTGIKIFRNLFVEEKVITFAEFVDLAGWKALERQDAGAAEVEGVQAAHYFYATKALLKATEGKDQKFIRDWIQEIQKTKWLRTNSDTVVSAYRETGGSGDLYEILKKVVPSQTDPAP